MHADPSLRTLNPYHSMLVMERAKREALRLRREAIDAFWGQVLSAFARWRWPARPHPSSRQTTAPPST
jgi:hypothetical protein